MQIPLRSVVLAAGLLMVPGADAQPQDTRVSTAPAPEPESPDASTQQQVAALLNRARASYRQGQVAERIDLRVSWPEGREIKSQVRLLLDQGIPSLGWPRRLRLELGRLTVSADDKSIVVVNTQDPGTYFTAVLPEGLTLAALRGVIPPLPLPQLDWALTDDQDRIDASRAIAGAGPIEWGPQTTESRDHQFSFKGTAEGGPVELTIDADRATLVHISAPYGPPGPSGQARLTIDVAPLPQDKVPAADKWSIDTTGRAAVGFLADLKGRPPEIASGERLPTLGLMNADMTESPTLQSLLDSSADGPFMAGRPVFGVLIMYRAAPGGPSPDVLSGIKAVSDLKSLIAAKWPAADKRPRIAALVVPCLDLPECNRIRLGELERQWGPVVGAPARAYFPTGNGVLDRLARKSSAAMVVIDADQRVLKSIPLDGRASEDEAVANEAMSALTEALGPLP